MCQPIVQTSQKVITIFKKFTKIRLHYQKTGCIVWYRFGKHCVQPIICLSFAVCLQILRSGSPRCSSIRRGLFLCLGRRGAGRAKSTSLYAQKTPPAESSANFGGGGASNQKSANPCPLYHVKLKIQITTPATTATTATTATQIQHDTQCTNI